MRFSVAFPAALAAFILPFAIGCSLTGAGVDQVPESVAQRLKEARERGPTTDRPLEIYPEALVSSQAVVERFEALERGQKAQDRALSQAVESARTARAELASALASESEQRARATEAAAALEAQHDAALQELGQNLERQAEERAQQAAELERAEAARTELLRRLVDNEEATRALVEALSIDREVTAGRLAQTEAALSAIDGRQLELMPLTETIAQLEREVDALGATADAADWDGGARFKTLEASVAMLVARLDGENRVVPAEIAALRSDIVALRGELRLAGVPVVESITPASVPSGQVSPGSTETDSVGAQGTSSAPDLTTNREPSWIMVIYGALLVILAVTLVLHWFERRRALRSDARLERLERLLDGLGQRIEVVAERTRDRRAASLAPATPPAVPPTEERRVERIPVAVERRERADRTDRAERSERPTARVIAAAVAASTPADAVQDTTRWERFVDRVEQPQRAGEPAVEPAVDRSARSRRVLDQLFLDQYRRDGADAGGR